MNPKFYLKPTWSELTSWGLVYRSATTRKEVISIADVRLLLSILKSDYGEKYVFLPIAGKHEITREEYEQIIPILEEGIRVFSYEEPKTREEILQQIRLKIKRRSGK